MLTAPKISPVHQRTRPARGMRDEPDEAGDADDEQGGGDDLASRQRPP